jgi:purine-binding chemotaxis protein CheW
LTTVVPSSGDPGSERDGRAAVEPPAGARLLLVTFTLAGHRAAVLADRVVEAARMVAVVPLPGAPPAVAGAINFRGRVVPVLDVHRRLAWPSLVWHPDQFLLVVRTAARLVALGVEGPLDLLSAPTTRIDTTSRSVPGLPLVAGIVRLDDGLLVIHDLDRFLSLDEAIALDHAVRAAGPGRPEGA